MDIKITESSLRKFVATKATIAEIAEKSCLCGPTFDRMHSIGNDQVLEIEAITNRIDTANVFGVAREVAAILSTMGIKAKLVNDPYQLLNEPGLYSNLPQCFAVEIPNENFTPRFCAIALDNIKVKASPKETRVFLENCDQRSINNVIDITNELTLLYGIPSHIFDLDKIPQGKLIMRESKSEEIITTLDDTQNKLAGNDLVFQNVNGDLLDLCGVMGGNNAVVDNSTERILFIVPIYEPRHIRKTSLFVQKRSLASQLYEKQPDTELCLSIIHIGIDLFSSRAGAKVCSSIFDYYPAKNETKILSLDPQWLNSFIGIQIPEGSISEILESIGFHNVFKNKQFLVTVPSWRYHDINIREDLAEEVTRIYGYYRLPAILPSVNTGFQLTNPLLSLESSAKHYLADIGFHEVYNNSLISEVQIQKSDLDPKKHLKLKNSLTSDNEYLRIWLYPSLLNNYKNNQDRFDSPKLFEVANIYQRQDGKDLPVEVSHLCFVSDMDYRHTKGVVESLFNHLHLNEDTPYIISKVSSKIKRAFGLKKEVYYFEINLQESLSKLQKNRQYSPISTYPDIIDDVTIESKQKIGNLIKQIKATSSLIITVEYLTGYEDKHSFRLTFNSKDRNLTQEEVNQIKQKVMALG